jgi:hypothetical protein
MKIEIKDIEFTHNDIYDYSIYPESGVYIVSYPGNKSLIFASKKEKNIYSLLIDSPMNDAIYSSLFKEGPETNTNISEDTLLKLASILTHNTKPKDLDR